MIIKTAIFHSDFLLYHYSGFWYYDHYRFFDHYPYHGIFKKKSGKNKNKLIATYPKNHENFKYSKPMVQFY